MLLRRNKAFAAFWLAQTISFAGTGITTVVLPVLVFQMTGSPGWVAALSAIAAMPYLALGLLVGAMADRLDRRKIMVASDATAALLLASAPVAAIMHALVLAHLLVMALGVAVVFVWFDAARFGALAALVDRPQLPTAGSLINSSGAVALIVAPTLGAALLAVMRPPYALGFDAATYVLSAVLLTSIRRPFGQPRPRPGGRGRIRADIIEGLRFLWHQPVIRAMTLSVFCVCLCWGGTFGLLVVYASRALHLARADTRLGLLYSAGELGGFVASAALPLLIKRLPVGRMVMALMTAFVAALAFLAAAPAYGWALVAFSLYELAYVLVLSTGITVRQTLTPDHLQSRVNTTGRMIAWGGSPVGAVLGGVLATVAPIRVAFALLAIGGVVGAVLVGWSCLGVGTLAAISAPRSADLPEPSPQPPA